jgi:hypothetical protein
MTQSLQADGGIRPNCSARHRDRIGRPVKLTGTFVLAGLLVALVSACAETGDFGRRKPGLFEGKSGLDWPSSFPASRTTLTDDESELRQRAMTMMRNPQSPQFPTLDLFEAVIANDAKIYFDRITGQADSSVAARYQRVMRDADADLMLIPRLRAVICRVAVADHARLAALDVADAVTDDEKSAARDRVAANAAWGQSAETALALRANAYHDALERLYGLSPYAAITPSLAAVKALQAEIAKGNACLTPIKPRQGIIRKG